MENTRKTTYDLRPNPTTTERVEEWRDYMKKKAEKKKDQTETSQLEGQTGEQEEAESGGERRQEQEDERHSEGDRRSLERGRNSPGYGDQHPESSQYRERDRNSEEERSGGYRTPDRREYGYRTPDRREYRYRTPDRREYEYRPRSRSHSRSPQLMGNDVLVAMLQKMELKMENDKKEMMGKMENIDTNQESMKEDMKDKMENMEHKMENIDTNQKNMEHKMENMEHKMETHKKEIMEDNKRKMECLEKTMNNKIKRVELTVLEVQEKTKAIETDMQCIRNNTNTQINRICQDIQKLDRGTNEELRAAIIQVNSVQEKHKQLEDKIKEIEKNPIGGVPNINITCTGGQNLDQNLPKFNGKEPNPMNYITRFSRYYENILAKRIPKVTLDEAIEWSLEGSANKWYQVNKQYMTDLYDYRKEFLKKYWGQDIQKSLKRRLEVEKYRPGGKMNRAEYFIDRISLLKNMTPTMEEYEMVDLLCYHFEEHIQDARRVQNLNTILDFEGLLDRMDMDYRNQKIRSNNRYEEENPRRREVWNRPTGGYSPKNKRTEYSPKQKGNYYREVDRRPDNNKPNWRPSPSKEEYNKGRYQTNNNPRYREERRSPRKEWRDDRRKEGHYQNQYSPRKRYPTQEQQEVCQAISIQTTTDEGNRRNLNPQSVSPKAKGYPCNNSESIL